MLEEQPILFRKSPSRRHMLRPGIGTDDRELLRVIRRFSLKELLTDDSLQYLSLKILSLALAANSRGQNHFKSIGGVVVHLDCLGFPSNYARLYSKFVLADGLRDDKPLQKTFQLHILALEVVKEAVFGNTDNLQFLCENGRVHKFANSFCSPAFGLQDLEQEKDFSVHQAIGMPGLDAKENENCGRPDPAVASACHPPSASFCQFWNDYVVMLSRGLCSFILARGGSKYLGGNAHNMTELSALLDALEHCFVILKLLVYL